jgi:hypothetical protein
MENRKLVKLRQRDVLVLTTNVCLAISNNANDRTLSREHTFE